MHSVSVLSVVVLTLLATMLLNPTTALDKTKLATPAKCANACAAVYEPICGGNKAGADVGTSGTDKPVTFGSECVMNNYNCETDKKFVVLHKGECEGKAAVRLS